MSFPLISNDSASIRKASSFIFSRFTSILGNKKFGESKSPEIRQSNRISSTISSPLPAWIYPKECNLCLKYRVQYKSKKYEPYQITTYAAENTIKAAAKAKNEMLYKEIKDLDLIAKEFKVHKHCYQQYTSGHAFSSRSNVADDKEMSSEESSYDTGKFNEVKEFVTDEILGLGKAVSMKVLHEIYGLTIGDTRYRNRLKKRLQEHFKEKISFVTPKTKTAEIIIPCDCLDGNF